MGDLFSLSMHRSIANEVHDSYIPRISIRGFSVNRRGLCTNSVHYLAFLLCGFPVSLCTCTYALFQFPSFFCSVPCLFLAVESADDLLDDLHDPQGVLLQRRVQPHVRPQFLDGRVAEPAKGGYPSDPKRRQRGKSLTLQRTLGSWETLQTA